MSLSSKLPFGITRYPVGYNVKVHGPYHPGRYYGPVETPLSEVKMGELAGWLGRRNYSPLSMIRAFFRSSHRWMNTWQHTRYGFGAGLCQFIMVYSFVFYLIQYPVTIKYHKHCKYH